jgi:hypothetical protein
MRQTVQVLLLHGVVSDRQREDRPVSASPIARGVRTGTGTGTGELSQLTFLARVDRQGLVSNSAHRWSPRRAARNAKTARGVSVPE